MTNKNKGWVTAKSFILISTSLIAFNLGGCALLKSPSERAEEKIYNDLNLLSNAASAYLKRTEQPPHAGGPVSFGGFLLATRLIERYPAPPLVGKRLDWPLKQYRYEYLPNFGDLGGPTNAAEAVLWLPGISRDICQRINKKHTLLGLQIPIYRSKNDIPQATLFCIDLGKNTYYSAVKIHNYR